MSQKQAELTRRGALRDARRLYGAPISLKGDYPKNGLACCWYAIASLAGLSRATIASTVNTVGVIETDRAPLGVLRQVVVKGRVQANRAYHEAAKFACFMTGSDLPKYRPYLKPLTKTAAKLAANRGDLEAIATAANELAGRAKTGKTVTPDQALEYLDTLTR